MAVAEPGDLVALVRADPVLAPFADALERQARKSIRLRPDWDAKHYPGGSRVGGPPAVPIGFQWPTRHVDMPTPSPKWVAANLKPRLLPPDGMSLFQFIAQIDLAAVAPFDVDGLLPHDGTLLFFYDEIYQSDIDPKAGLAPNSLLAHKGRPGGAFHTEVFGWDKVDQARVIHLPAGLTLEMSESGPIAPYALPLVPSEEWTLPSTDAFALVQSTEPPDEQEGRLVLPPEAWQRLRDLRYELRANADIDQMLGWEDNAAHGPSLAPGDDWKTMSLAERIADELDVRLLLQLSPPTYEPTGIEFGRTLYFYVRESDLRRGDFSRAWYDSD